MWIRTWIRIQRKARNVPEICLIIRFGRQDPIQKFGSPTVRNDPEHSVLRSQLEEVKARLKSARTEVVRLEQVGAFTITYFTFSLFCLWLKNNFAVLYDFVDLSLAEVQVPVTYFMIALLRGVPRILPGGMHIYGWPTPPPPDLYLDQDPHQDFEPDPAPDPHKTMRNRLRIRTKQCGFTALGSTVKRLLSNL